MHMRLTLKWKLNDISFYKIKGHSSILEGKVIFDMAKSISWPNSASVSDKDILYPDFHCEYRLTFHNLNFYKYNVGGAS